MVANGGQSRKNNNLVLVVIKFVNLILPQLFLYSFLTCLYFLRAKGNLQLLAKVLVTTMKILIRFLWRI